MGNICLKNIYNRMPVSEKCCICKKQRFVGGDETSFRISVHGCKVCRLKKKYFNKDNQEVTITKYKLHRGRYS